MRGGPPPTPRFRDIRSPRSREDRAWKCIEKIPIDESAFPPHVKPAAIIIGVKGSNHARMQDEAGCCVQLRGRGISSPGTPGADEPIHLWVKYDTPDQLQRVRDVLQEIIRSCEKGPPPELRKKASGAGPPLQGPPRARPPTIVGYPGGPPGVPMRPPPRPGMPPFEMLPDVLPPMPDRAPTSPLECFFTLHYLAHARPDLTTENLEVIYDQFFGYPLEERLRGIGGTLTLSLMMLPQVIRLEDLKTGAPPPSPNEVQPHMCFAIRPVMPIGFTYPHFANHVTQLQQPQPQIHPPPPPPPSSIPPMGIGPPSGPGMGTAPGPMPISAPVHQSPMTMRPMQPSHSQQPPSEGPTPSIMPRTLPPPESRMPGPSFVGPGGQTSSDYSGPLPPPQHLAIQGLHALLAERARQGVDPGMPLEGANETVRRWPGVPLHEIEELFARETGLRLDTSALGFPDLGTLIVKVAGPELLELYWNPAIPPRGGYFVRLGSQGLCPDFRLLETK